MFNREKGLEVGKKVTITNKIFVSK